MKLLISNLPYQGLFTNRLIKLPSDLGIEVYSETGSDFYWEHLIPKLFSGRSGAFSVHGPYQNIDLSLPDLQFDPVRGIYEKSFELCRTYGSEHCVCHPYAYTPKGKMSESEIGERKAACFEMVKELNRLSNAYGVSLLVENMPNKDGLLDACIPEFKGLFSCGCGIAPDVINILQHLTDAHSSMAIDISFDDSHHPGACRNISSHGFQIVFNCLEIDFGVNSRKFFKHYMYFLRSYISQQIDIFYLSRLPTWSAISEAVMALFPRL